MRSVLARSCAFIALGMTGIAFPTLAQEAEPLTQKPRTLEAVGTTPAAPEAKTGKPIPTANPRTRATAKQPRKTAVAAPPRTLPNSSSVVAQKPAMNDPMVRRVASEIPATAPTHESLPVVPTTTETASSADVVRPNVEIRQVAPAQLLSGKPSPIDILVTNHGDQAVDQVIVTDSIDASVEVVTSSPRSEQNGGTLVWSLGRMEPRETKKITFSIVSKKGSRAPTAVSRVSVSYTSTVESSIRLLTPDVAVKLTGPSKAMMGQPVELVLTLTNSGNAAATGLALRCALPQILAH